ncbi:MAG: peptidoglycan editing factor PgeF [Acidobacteriaceae bacterium]|nr:peptidoglycan editing factor PgeF [Acidobacteriaceae bacterium]
MFASFRLWSDGVYRCDALQEFLWQRHGFGTRDGQPPVDLTLKQIHSNFVLNASGLADRAEQGDALVTDEIGTSIGVRTADCVPIVMIDAAFRAVAVVHAGWRGTAAEIAKGAVERMTSDFGTRSRDLHVAIGPCIRECCYEVGPDVFAHFSRWGQEAPPGSRNPHLNLPEVNIRQLLEAGVPENLIFDSGLCTACQTGQFFSFRREREHAGRMIASVARLD